MSKSAPKKKAGSSSGRSRSTTSTSSTKGSSRTTPTQAASKGSSTGSGSASTTTEADYVLHLKKEHCWVINTALELYSRIGMGQLEEILQHCVFPNEKKPDDEQMSFYEKREDARRELERIKCALWALPHPHA